MYKRRINEIEPICKILKDSKSTIRQQRFCDIAGKVLNSHLSFTRNLVVTENTLLRSPQHRKATGRCASVVFKICGNRNQYDENTKLSS